MGYPPDDPIALQEAMLELVRLHRQRRRRAFILAAPAQAAAQPAPGDGSGGMAPREYGFNGLVPMARRASISCSTQQWQLHSACGNEDLFDGVVCVEVGLWPIQAASALAAPSRRRS